MAAPKASHVNIMRALDDQDPKLTSIILPWVLRNPRYFRSAFRLLKGIRRSRRARKRNLELGLKVPPFMIISITPECNLMCAGCYAAATGNRVDACVGGGSGTLPVGRWNEIISEACELGVFGFIIAGGEPFLYPKFIDLCKRFKDRFFIVLTNGTSLTEEQFRELRGTSNLVVVVSFEGGRDETDARRGEGVFNMARETIVRLDAIGVPAGISVTITRDNHRYWMEEQNIDTFIDIGARLGVFIEYIPTSQDHDRHLVLTSEQRVVFRESMLEFREKKPIYIIHSPGDEEFFGGCVSAGRGFAHITPAGDLTPCPVSNIATHNLTSSSLREGLAGPLFEKIRESEHLLETDGMPCALFAHPNELDELAREVGAYRASSGPPKK